MRPVVTAVEQPFSGLRVLMAEDDRVNQIVLRRMLEALGCDTEVVVNGLEAVDSWTDSSFGMVLMDRQMPELDGFGATTATSRNPSIGML